MFIRARAPLRLGLAGGGTDVSPYCDTHGGYVLNATIDRYAYAVIKPTAERFIRFRSTDQNIDEYIELSSYKEKSLQQLTLKLHYCVYRFMMNQFNDGNLMPMELSTFCDAPIGSGLGSSSTIVVAMIKAFVEFLNLAIDDYAIANLAYRIERLDCGLQGGRQDQYSATFGGFNFMEFYADERCVVNPLRIKDWVICELEASLLLFYTGASRESAMIIAEQSSHIESGESNALEAMHGIKKEAMTMKESILRGDFSGIVGSMLSGWESKKKSAKSVSNQNIENIYLAAIRAGASAGKISGAGGGGFMLFFVSPEKRMDVVRALGDFNGAVSNCHFTKYGAQAWRVR